MRYIGFSTGALAFGDFSKALDIMRNTVFNAIELSALRRHELEPLVASIGNIDLSQYKYVSVHAPSKIKADDESAVIHLLETFAGRGWPIVVHPDIMTEYKKWRPFGALLLIENMDERKSIGRTHKELQAIFSALPDARFCFDIAHARHVDPTMQEARLMLDSFAPLITQIHISGVEEHNFKHTRISAMAVDDYRRVANYVPQTAAVILESVVDVSEITSELKSVEQALWHTADTPVF